MFQVEEMFFVETQKAWAVALRPATPDCRLVAGDALVAGMRRWEVTEIHSAPVGLIGARLDGPSRITRQLIMRRVGDPIGDVEFKVWAILLVRLSRAMRTIDVDGILRRLEHQGETLSPVDRAIAKSALMGKHLVEHGATDEELTAAAAVLGIGNEI